MRSVRNEPRTSPRVKRCWMRASAKAGTRAPASACATGRAAPLEGLAFTAVHQGRVVGTVRLWHVSVGGIPALVLGPLAVDASCRKLGVGAALMEHALAPPRRAAMAR